MHILSYFSHFLSLFPHFFIRALLITVNLLHYQDHGAKVHIEDADGNTAINHAITEKHIHILTMFKKVIYEKKKLDKAKANERRDLLQRNKLAPISAKTSLTSPMKLLRVAQPNQDVLTPNKTNFNYQAASPYYVNIKCAKDPSRTLDKLDTVKDKITYIEGKYEQRSGTNQANVQKRKCARTISVDKLMQDVIVISSDSEEEAAPVPAMMKTNLFELTEENLGRHLVLCPKENSDSLITTWREKLRKTNLRESMLPKDSTQLDTFISEHITDSTSSQSAQTVIVTAVEPKTTDAPAESTNESFVTALDEHGEQILIEKDAALNVASDEMIIEQEKYEHVDVENNIVIYETRSVNRSMQTADHNSSSESGTQTTESALPTDYDTDNLRQELRHFGDKPGPITKNTKRLYLKRLVRYKKRPQLIQRSRRIVRSEYKL